jgi:hypothetical protein
VQFNNAGAFGGAAAVVYATTGTHVVVTAQASSAVPLCVKGAASQTGNLIELKNSSNSIICSMAQPTAANARLVIGEANQNGASNELRLEGDGATFGFISLSGLGSANGPSGLDYRNDGSGVRLYAYSSKNCSIGHMNLSRTVFTAEMQVDQSTTAGHTRLLLWDVDKGSLQRVSIGASDSGGIGFKVLRVPN